MKSGRSVFHIILLAAMGIIIGAATIYGLEHWNPEKSAGAHQELSKILEVQYIDVGQADCMLVSCDDEYMLIDAGGNSTAEQLCQYLDDAGVTRLKYAVATHPHEDHIGGMDSIILNYDIQTFMMPDVTTDSVNYANMTAALEVKKTEPVNPRAGDTYKLGEALITIVAPCSYDYGDNLNNYSIGIRIEYGETSFLMCGDAEMEAEYDMIDAGVMLKADVLKLSHHGSATSTSQAFLKAVNPDYAVISVGADNSYGHPADKILSRVEDYGVTIYRTDRDGTIVARSDGANIVFSNN